MPRNELRGDKASYSFSHDAVLVVCRPIIIVLRGWSLRKRLLVWDGNDYWFVLGATTVLSGNDYCSSLAHRSFRSTYSRLFGVK